MDGFDLTRTVPTMAVSFMGLTLIALPLIQILVYMFIRHAYPDGYKGVFLGMASYFLICNVLLTLVYLGEQYLGDQILQGISSEATSIALKNVGQVLSLIIECTILVECMEFSYKHFSYQPGTSKFGNALAFALGFSLVDALVWMANTFTNWILAVSINGMGLEAYSESLAAEEMEQFMVSIEPLLSNGPMYYAILFLERILFAAFIFAIVSMVQLVSRKLLQRTFMLVIIGIYFSYYLPALLRNMGVIKGNVITILLSLVIAVLANLFSWQVLKKTTPQETEYLSQIKAGGLYRIFFGQSGKKGTKKKSDISKNANMGKTQN